MRSREVCLVIASVTLRRRALSGAWRTPRTGEQLCGGCHGRRALREAARERRADVRHARRDGHHRSWVRAAHRRASSRHAGRALRRLAGRPRPRPRSARPRHHLRRAWSIVGRSIESALEPRPLDRRRLVRSIEGARVSIGRLRLQRVLDRAAAVERRARSSGSGSAR